MGNLQSPAKIKKGPAAPKKALCKSASCEETGFFEEVAADNGKQAEEEKVFCRRCPGNCGFQVTWHESHCCRKCSDHPGKHGKRCDQRPVTEALPESGRESTEASTSPSDAALLEQVTKLFAMLESKSTPVASALARLQELRCANQEAFPEVLGRCIDMVLSCTGPHLDAAILDTAFDVIVASCEGAIMPDGASLVMYIFCWLVLRLGDSEGDQVPRNKYARCYGARLLGRLYQIAAQEASAEGWPSGAHEGCEAVLLRLSRDRAPAVRLAAVTGLATMQTAAAQAALVRLSMVDTTVSIRLAALKGVVGHTCSQDSTVTNMYINRSLDAARSVRCCLYKQLASDRIGLKESKISDETFADLLRHGMNDVNTSVREAAEEMVCSWLKQEDDTESPLLKLLSVLNVEQNSKLAELVIQCLALKDEWRDILHSTVREPPADHDLYRDERALIWRTMVMLPDGGAAHYIADIGLEPIFTQIARSLERKHAFELRQLLLVVAAAGLHVHGECCCNSSGGCRLFEVAVSVLLHAPLKFEVEPQRPSAQCLALVIIQNTLKCCSRVCTSTAKAAHLDARFLIVVNSILVSLQSPGVDAMRVVQKFSAMPDCNTDESTLSPCGHAIERPSEAHGFTLLGERFDTLARQRQSQADDNDEDLNEELRETSQCLSMVTLRALGIAEEALGLLSMANAEESLVLLDDLANIWFRPTLVRADVADAVVGASRNVWSVLRAVAVRCLALHTSLCPDLSASHWNFFLLVLKRYAPMIVSSKKDGGKECATSSIVESCVHFLVDTQLVHRHMSDPSEVDARAGELFAAVAGLLGLPSHRMQLPLKFRRCLAERLCMLLLFGGVWRMDQSSNEENSSSYLGSLERIPEPARWVLTGLLVEAFFRPPPTITASGKSAQVLKEAAQESTQRGCLLQFFSALSDISGMHATLLAAACEGILATELWRLAVPAQLGCGRRWRALQLPRLLRLLSRHLVVAAGQQGTTAMIVSAWLECVWRPLALICLDCKQDAPERHLLAEALLATLVAIEVASESRSQFTAATDWPAAATEVTHVLSLILHAWGWHRRGLVRCDTAGSDIATDASRSGHNVENMKTPLLKLASRFCTRFAQIESNVEETWQAAELEARRRRDNLREAFAKQGVDTPAIVESATEVIRVRPSRAFLSGRRPHHRRTSGSAMTSRQRRSPIKQKRRLSLKGNKRRHRKIVISDDDSDASGHRDEINDPIENTPRPKRRRQASFGGS